MSTRATIKEAQRLADFIAARLDTSLTVQKMTSGSGRYAVIDAEGQPVKFTAPYYAPLAVIIAGLQGAYTAIELVDAADDPLYERMKRESINALIDDAADDDPGEEDEPDTARCVACGSIYYRTAGDTGECWPCRWKKGDIC